MPKECSHYHTIAFISHARKVMVKILQARLQQYVNCELPDVQASFRKGRGTRDQIANIRWIIEKARDFQKNIYFCFIDYAKAFDCVDHNKLWEILKEMGIPDHLTFLLRNLYAGQEATVRTGHGTTDWFQIGKGVHQGYILSPFLYKRNSFLNIHWKDWCWSWNSNTLTTWCEELTHLKRPWWWERLKVEEGDDRRWYGWMAYPSQWTWVWVNSGSWWWTGWPGMLRPWGCKESDTTEWLNWTNLFISL